MLSFPTLIRLGRQLAAGAIVSVSAATLPLAAQQAGAKSSAAKPSAKKSAPAKTSSKKSTASKSSAKKSTTRKATRSTSRRPVVPEMPVRAAADDSTAAREARGAFSRYTEAFNGGRDADAIAFYSDDSRFHWIEDGRLAYTSAAMIRESIAGVRKLFPTMVFEPGDVRTTVFGRDAVQLTVPFAQRLVDGGGVESRFEGTMTLSLTKSSGSWRAISGHTSIRRPSAR